METIANSLIKFANCRDKAYRQTHTLTAARAAAVSKIKRLADYYRGKSHDVQLKIVIQLEAELLLILPDEESRYTRLRSKVLELLEKAHIQN